MLMKKLLKRAIKSSVVVGERFGEVVIRLKRIYNF
jgi:hypothetical protein